MTIRAGKVIVDTNILMNALDFRKCNVYDWIDEVYEEIFVHIEVVNEFRIETEQKAIIAEIKKRGWNLFDHNDQTCLPNNQKTLYWKYVNNASEGFENLKTKKEAQKRIPKTSSNLGEIHSLALAQLISANIINSNDYEIREVIEDEKILVYSTDIERDIFIEQDTVEDFCTYCVQGRIAKPSDVIKFFRVCHANDDKEKLSDKLASLKQRLVEHIK
ncbi:hypothetical protein FIU87_21170 [Bacillus sp. THAF10]|uniref:hypothetical protein n=1 Tax=Bacillus sp. THAF10 TaxID=2587848 RepID=UPI001267AEF4|nr:hypothetical protein [Bacillus sp. THAF10]QFT91166.1 hypothetical protein FIU87_21170 [Bacillus sp. THAF10]